MRRDAAFPLAESVALGLLLGLHAVEAGTQRWYAHPEPRSTPPIVAFEREVGVYKLPLVHETHYWDTDSYQTFYVWAQRLGLVPRVRASLDEALLDDALVMIRPRRDVPADVQTELMRYVRGGGKLLVIDELDLPGSTANQILAPFAMRVESFRWDPELDLTPLGLYRYGSTLTLPSASLVRGGKPFLRTTGGEVVGAARRGRRRRRRGPGDRAVARRRPLRVRPGVAA